MSWVDSVADSGSKFASQKAESSATKFRFCLEFGFCLLCALLDANALNLDSALCALRFYTRGLAHSSTR
ncbi:MULTISPECIES: hypothetical protein [unclassified Helicobacter]|uniref:hypothetical protein n=1 Tax=unclassified Helicobacter TaxID=2593540 RepID=UPI00115F8CF6|nr:MULTISPECIES: hypothetical protein [unclassified Helicobacter]